MVGNVYVTRQQLQQKLYESNGLNTLIELMELQIAQSQAAKAGAVVTPADIAAQTQRYTDNVFKDDAQIQSMRDRIGDLDRAGKTAQANAVRQDMAAEQKRLLDQLLDQRKVTQTDFAIAMETATYLRKIAEPLLQDKITEENVETAFRVIYGEQVRVRHIALANMQEVSEAKRRLADGRSFEQVAREMSRNSDTAPSGGQLPPFTRDTPGFPQAFKDTAFALKVGEVSDPVEANGVYHLIKMEERIAPKTVKFDDVKDAVRQTIFERLIEQSVRTMQHQIQLEIFDSLKITDDTLRQQFEKRMAERRAQVGGPDQVRQELRQSRTPTTGPADDLLPPTSQPVIGGGAGSPPGK